MSSHGTSAPDFTASGARKQLIRSLGHLLGHVVKTNARHGKNGRVSVGCEGIRQQLVDHLDRFQLSSVPTTAFVERLDRYMKCSCSVYIASIVLLDRVSTRVGLCLDRDLFCQLFFGCFLLARKVLEDRCVDLRYSAQVGGFLPYHPGGESAGIEHLYRLELLLCRALNWDLLVPESQFWHYSQKIFLNAGVTASVLDEDSHTSE